MVIQSKRELGSYGEKIATDFLQKNNYKIICKNFRVGRWGEIDIIARDGEYICFIEVKTRRGLTFGAPSEAVTKSKQANIRKLACVFLDRYDLNDSSIRFDVVEIRYKSVTDYDVNLIKNAF